MTICPPIMVVKNLETLAVKNHVIIRDLQNHLHLNTGCIAPVSLSCIALYSGRTLTARGPNALDSLYFTGIMCMRETVIGAPREKHATSLVFLIRKSTFQKCQELRCTGICLPSIQSHAIHIRDFFIDSKEVWCRRCDFWGLDGWAASNLPLASRQPIRNRFRLASPVEETQTVSRSPSSSLSFHHCCHSPLLNDPELPAPE